MHPRSIRPPPSGCNRFVEPSRRPPLRCYRWFRVFDRAAKQTDRNRCSQLHQSDVSILYFVGECYCRSQDADHFFDVVLVSTESDRNERVKMWMLRVRRTDFHVKCRIFKSSLMHPHLQVSSTVPANSPTCLDLVTLDGDGTNHPVTTVKRKRLSLWNWTEKFIWSMSIAALKVRIIIKYYLLIQFIKFEVEFKENNYI